MFFYFLSELSDTVCNDEAVFKLIAEIWKQGTNTVDNFHHSDSQQKTHF